MHVKYKLEVVDHKSRAKKVVAPEQARVLEGKVKVVGDFCFVVSILCFSIDVFVMFVVYPDAWIYLGCCGFFGLIFLMLSFVCWNMDQVRAGYNNIRLDFEKYFRSGKIIVLMFCLLFFIFLFFVLKYFC